MSHAEQIVPMSPAGLPVDEATDFESTNLLSLVLKAPREFADRVARDRFDGRASLTLLSAALAFDALYGLAMGAFAGGDTLWMTALKVPLIALASIALCAPSLYVLLGLSGSPVGLRQAVAVLSGAACLTSMLLVGFAPVAWLFGVSTTNVQFMIVLHIAVCGIGVGYGLRLLGTSVPSGFAGNKVLVVWTTMFLMVCAQMLTHLRPLLTAAADGTFREDRKQFFFEHLLESMTGRTTAVAAERDAPGMRGTSQDAAVDGAKSAPTSATAEPDGVSQSDALLAKLFPGLPEVGSSVLPERGSGKEPLTLDSLQRMAASNSPLIAQARADIVSFRGTAIQAGTHTNPIIDYESDTVGSSETRDYQGAYVSQVIETMNKLGLQRAVANLDHLNAQLALQKTRIEVSSQVKAVYYAVLVAGQNVIISAASVRFTEQFLGLQTEKLRRLGESASYEPAQLRALVEAARAGLVAAQNSYVVAWKKLAATVGVPDLPPSQLVGEAAAPPPEINFQEALERMWRVHPDVLVGRNMQALAQYQVRLGKVRRASDVNAYGAIQKDFTTPGVNHAVYNEQLGVPLPLVDRNRGAAMNAQGDLTRAEQQVRRVQSDLQRQLAAVCAAYETNRGNVRRYRDAVLPDATRACREVYDRYIESPELLTVTDIAFAQQQLATAIAQYINSLDGQWRAAADLAGLLQIEDFNDLYDLRNAPVEGHR